MKSFVSSFISENFLLFRSEKIRATTQTISNGCKESKNAHHTSIEINLWGSLTTASIFICKYSKIKLSIFWWNTLWSNRTILIYQLIIATKSVLRHFNRNKKRISVKKNKGVGCLRSQILRVLLRSISKLHTKSTEFSLLFAFNFQTWLILTAKKKSLKFQIRTVGNLKLKHTFNGIKKLLQ